ncbi:hypothetical protein [Aureibaculum conchae]|uniref:hypothetical protein n=1 Tax=Aureibaculum sp. 2308TA14-22 TaxID=3108392 RepID=UPI00339880BB
MKKFIFFVLATCTILSCSTDEPEDDKVFDADKYPQKWKLVKITGSWTNIETTGENMEWQENYILNDDGTFTKHREQGKESFNVPGTFSIVEHNGEKFLELVHEVDTNLIVNCYSNQTESLWLKSDINLINTAGACDWPKLEYKQVE